jgi:hypothetical protein
LAFLRNNTAEMEQQVAWGAGKPGVDKAVRCRRMQCSNKFTA